jgi:hypothetical protein
VTVASFVPSLIPAVVAARQRATVRKFRAAGANDPTRARTLEELGVRDDHLLRRMVRSGVVATLDERRFFLSADGLAAWERRSRIGILVALGVVLIGVLIALGLAGP